MSLSSIIEEWLSEEFKLNIIFLNRSRGTITVLIVKYLWNSWFTKNRLQPSPLMSFQITRQYSHENSYYTSIERKASSTYKLCRKFGPNSYLPVRSTSGCSSKKCALYLYGNLSIAWNKSFVLILYFRY